MRTGRLILLAFVVAGPRRVHRLGRAPRADDRRAQGAGGQAVRRPRPGQGEEGRRRPTPTAASSSSRTRTSGRSRRRSPTRPTRARSRACCSRSTGLKAERTFAAKDVKLAEYGLDKPPLSVTVEDDAGKSYTLKLGAELPLGNTRAAETGDGNVYLVSKYVASDLDKDLAGWRSDELAQVYSTDVASLTVTCPDGQVALAHAGSAVDDHRAGAGPRRPRPRRRPDHRHLGRADQGVRRQRPGPQGARPRAAPRRSVTIVQARCQGRAARARSSATSATPRTASRSRASAATRVLGRGEDRLASGGRVAGVALEEAGRVRQLGAWTSSSSQAGAAKASLERKDGIWKAGATEVDGDAVSRRLDDARRPRGQGVRPAEAFRRAARVASSSPAMVSPTTQRSTRGLPRRGRRDRGGAHRGPRGGRREGEGPARRPGGARQAEADAETGCGAGEGAAAGQADSRRPGREEVGAAAAPGRPAVPPRGGSPGLLR